MSAGQSSHRFRYELAEQGITGDGDLEARPTWVWHAEEFHEIVSTVLSQSQVRAWGLLLRPVLGRCSLRLLRTQMLSEGIGESGGEKQ